MSKMKLVLNVIDDIRVLADNLMVVIGGVRNLADSLQEVADAMMSEEEKPRKLPEKKPAKAIEAKAEPAEKAVALEEVRAVLTDKSRKGHTAAVKELLIKYGANKLSDVDPKHYAALLADAEVL